MIVNHKSATVFLLAALTCMLTGCGGADIPELGDVKGVVKMNGEPVKGIDVVAYPVDGRPAFGKTDENGAYSLMFKHGISGTKVGQNRISPTWTNGGPTVPKEFTEMMFDIKPGENTIDFDMKSDLPAWKGVTAPSKKPKKQVPLD
ncbi:MAG: hypothetical protein DWH81_05570 [Planctomycetota bacterium]|nr:MAG: hypothetical protein DWH81_05570 [Planctomycetota bacterium]